MNSSYLLVTLKEWSLWPLAIHYDNTWDTAIATENIKIMLEKSDIYLYIYVIAHKGIDDIFEFVVDIFKEYVADNFWRQTDIMYKK